MAKIKHTKNELKAQRDSLRRYERYLPTLQLKKQQLQMEVRRVEAELAAKAGEEDATRNSLAAWVKLFSEAVPENLEKASEDEIVEGLVERHIKLESVRTEEGNIAGVAIPVLEDVTFDRKVPDLFETPAWLDDGVEILEQLIRFRAERLVMEEQHRRLKEELRTTNQRVNLFEKVKIPECKEHIRVIRIFLGDQQTAAVARAKIAKGKSVEKVIAA